MHDIQWKRIVLKVGSALIAPDRQGCSSRYLLSIAQFIVQCRAMGTEVILVSSGSVAAGAHHFPKMDDVPITVKKAMAAAGQTDMMATWNRFFDFPSAQILLTHGDLRDRERYESIRETVFSLLVHKVMPIINENDTVTTDKLKVGDNDNLSAMVAAAAEADALIICSDVDGLFDKNPNLHADAQHIPVVTQISDEIYAMAGGAASAVGTGGMRTKIEAAEKATSHGITTYIINGFTQEAFDALLAGDNPGTVFRPYDQPMQEHIHWMTHTSTEQGELVIESDSTSDAQAIEDITSDEILEVRGNFSVGDTILVRTDDGTRIAKAKSNYSSCLLSFIADNDDTDFASRVEQSTGPIISNKNIAVLEQQ